MNNNKIIKGTNYIYELTYNNKVRNRKTGRILKEGINSNGYKQVEIKIYGKYKKPLIHYMIWERYNGKKPENMDIDHIDHNKTNNKIKNLRLLTRQQNIIDRKVKPKGYYKTKNGKYRVIIKVNGKLKCFGTYKEKHIAKEIANKIFAERNKKLGI